MDSHSPYHMVFPYMFLGIIILSFLSPWSLLAMEKQDLSIANVYADSKSFTPENQEYFILHFTLSETAQVTLAIYDSLNREVRTLLDSISLEAGNHQVTWNGIDNTGNILPQNYYLYTIEATNADGQHVRYDPSDLTGGKQIGIQNIKYDKVEDNVFFTLQQSAIINLRVGLVAGGPMMTTLIDWLPLTGGNHTVAWDGRDNTGTVDLKNVRKLEINGPAYSLPMNSIILEGKKHLLRPEFLPVAQTTGNIRPVVTDPMKRMMYNHWQHPRDKCYDPEVAISFPADQGYTEDGIVIIDGPTKITLNTNIADRQFLLEQRFEIVLYVDFLFSHEEEAGYLPYFWTWDPHGIEGVHYITAMLRGYEGHFATHTVKVFVGKKQRN